MNKPPWINHCPPYDPQYSGITHTDVQDCSAESGAHILFFVTGFWASPEALAIDMGLYDPKTGSMNTAKMNVSNAIATIKNIGVVPYSACPTPQSFTMQQYYSVDTSKLQHFKFDLELIAPNLLASPIWEELEWGMTLPEPTKHLVCGIEDNGQIYFDSEQGSPIKNIINPSALGAAPASIVWQSSIIINNPIMQIFTVIFADGKTFGIAINTPNGLQIIKATDEAQWRSWNDPTSYGMPTVNGDGTTNWNAQYTLPF